MRNPYRLIYAPGVERAILALIANGLPYERITIGDVRRHDPVIGATVLIAIRRK